MAPVDRVAPTVVVTLEAHDLRAARVPTRESECREHRLGTRVGEPDEVDARYMPHCLLGCLELEVVAESEHRTAGPQDLDDRLGQLRWPVPEDERAVGEVVVDVIVAVDVTDMRAAPALEIDRIRMRPRWEDTRDAGHAPRQARLPALGRLLRS